jgi:hypothetical protein
MCNTQLRWVETITPYHACQLHLASQDAEEVSSAADGVATTIELMIDECPAADAVGGELAALGRQLAEARERVERAAVAAAAAPVGEGGAQAVAGT